MSLTEFGRQRFLKTVRTRTFEDLQLSPFPWMSFPEGIVFKWLIDNNIPFSWRNFDGSAPLFESLLLTHGYHPEFTIKELKTVIIIQGNFFGLLPSVLDKVSLAKVSLEMDGWRVVILWENELRRVSVETVLTTYIPDIKSVHGPYRPPTWDVPDVRRRLRESRARREPTWTLEPEERPAQRGTERRRERERLGARRRGPGGRRRFGVRRFGMGSPTGG